MCDQERVKKHKRGGNFGNKIKVTLIIIIITSFYYFCRSKFTWMTLYNSKGMRVSFLKLIADIQKHKRQYEVEEDSSDSDYDSSDGSESESQDESGSKSGNDSSVDSGKGSELSRTKLKCRRSLLPSATTPTARKKGRDVNYVSWM